MTTVVNFTLVLVCYSLKPKVDRSNFFSIIWLHTFGRRSNENMVEVEIIIFFILKE